MFSWSSSVRRSGGDADYPAQRATVVEGSIRASADAFSRQEHLNSYLEDDILKRSTRKVVPGDDTTYDTVFSTVNRDTLMLRVHMDKNSTLPRMNLVGVTATHSWINQRGQVVGYPHTQSLAIWTESQLLLGQAVHQVIEKLQTEPPEVFEFTDPGLARIQPPRQSQPAAVAEEPSPPAYHDHFTPDLSPPVSDAPAIPQTFPEVQELERERIEELLENHLQMQLFCHATDFCKTQLSIFDDLRERNEATAQVNLEKEQELVCLREQVVKLQETLRGELKDFRALEKNQNALLSPPDKRQVAKDLKALQRQAYEASEQIAEDWLEEGYNTADFLSKFMKQRMMYHTRCAKGVLLANQ